MVEQLIALVGFVLLYAFALVILAPLTGVAVYWVVRAGTAGFFKSKCEFNRSSNEPRQ